jgi:hypothetical protein
VPLQPAKSARAEHITRKNKDGIAESYQRGD